ncbi:MAG: PQQ-binding-like beta-propeller repeat protein [bacterium]
MRRPSVLSTGPLLAAVWLAAATPACNSLEGGAYRRQRLVQTDITHRAFVQPRWRRTLRDHHIFTYMPEEFAGAGASHGGERVYIGTGAGRLYCFQASSGAVIWELLLGGAISAPPLIVERLGMLFIGSADGVMSAIELETGKRKWLYRTKGVAYRAPVYADGVIYFANHRDKVYSLDARTGRWRWSYDRETPESFTVAGHSRPVIYKDNLYVGFSDGMIVCLGARGGNARWTRSLAGSSKEYVDVDSTPVIHNDVLYVSSFSGGLYALTADGGALRWRFPVRGASTVAVSADRIYFATPREGLHALDLEGNLRWRQRVEAGTPRLPQVRGRALYVSFSEGGLMVIDRLTGKLIQSFNPGGGISGPSLITRDSLYVLSNRGHFYALTLK